MSSITPAITEFRAEAALVDGVIQPARILVEDGRITDLHVGDGPAEWLDELGAHVVVIPAGQVLLPAVVDTHVHMNEPGRTEWEGIRTATRAAAAGGVATVIDMPLNSIPSTVDVPALELKQALAREKSSVDVGFWGGAVPQSLGHLSELHEAGVFGFKCFLAPSGVDEFEHLNPEQLLVALAEIAEIDSLLIVHAEDGALLEELAPPLNADYSQFLASRPPVVEDTAIAHLIDGVRATGARVHILHLSSASALPLLRAAKAEGLPITVETCPHYLTLNAEGIPEGATEFKCCPPIRDAANADLLWEALLDGTIDCIVSDHSPSPASMKYGHGADFGLAWGGISSLQLGLSVVWTEAFTRGIPLEKVVHWMSEATAGLVGLEDRGYISQGRQADFAVFAPTMPYEVDAEKLQHKHPITPYNHKTFHGRVVSTWLRGQQIYSLDEGVIQTPIQLL